jgi:hypothetical protein
MIKISPDVLFYIHVPKCAGSSFGSYFDRVLRPEGRFFWHGFDGDVNIINDFERGDADTGINFIGGHFTISTVNLLQRRLGLKSSRICSILRDPFEQALSYYNWLTSSSKLAGSPHPLYDYCENLTPDEFFSDPIVANEVVNIQSRYLLGIVPDMNTSHEEFSRISREVLRDNDILISTVENSKNMADYISKKYYRINFEKNITRYEFINKSNGVLVNMNSELRAMLTELFWADIILFEEAKRCMSVLKF